MDHGGILELLALRLDGELTQEERRALEEHLAACPDCRTAGAQLAALQESFQELEEIPVPEGFTQGVMERIRATEPKKVIPLFRRPQFRALAGLAACAVLTLGVYSAVQARKDTGSGDFAMMTRSFQQDAAAESADEAGGDLASATPDCALEAPSAPEALDSGLEVSSAAEALDSDPETPPAQVRSKIASAPAAPETAPEASEGPREAPSIPEAPDDGLEAPPAPQAAAYATSVPENGGTSDVQGMVLEGKSGAEDWEEFDELLVLDRLPDGAVELMGEDVAVSRDMETGADTYYWLTPDTLAAIEELACQQGLIPGTSESSPAGERCALQILNP